MKTRLRKRLNRAKRKVRKCRKCLSRKSLSGIERSMQKGARLYRRFWGVHPKKLRILGCIGQPKRQQREVFVSLGRSPAVTVANGPKGRATKITRRPIRGRLATSYRGKRLCILTDLKRGLAPANTRKFLGWIPKTEYIPSAALEKAGSFKAGAHWQHMHHERGGKWPKAYRDGYGNIIYGPSSYTIGKWLER